MTTMTSLQTIIEEAPLLTERLLLRPPQAADADAIPVHSREQPNAVGQVDLADARAWIARARLNAGARTVSIVEKKSGATIGAAGMAPMADHPGRQEVMLWIGNGHTGQGYGTEAAHALIDHVFGLELAASLWCVARLTNMAGRRIMEKCGFQHRETGMARSIALRGTIPVDRFILERRTWLGLRSWGAMLGARDHAGRAA
jgi:RimJ/RimL family protein N-acetyltransferase